MKKIDTIAIMATALLAFASCQKETLVSETLQPAMRTLTATFENAGTKTTLGENDKPLWAENDVIRLLDGTSYQDITLTSGMISGGSVALTTTLMGENIYAIYPASATTMDKCTDGNIVFIIPAKQDGTFASANICVAKKNDDDKLVFHNVTAVLEFSQTVSTGVRSVKVKAESNIAGTLTATFDGSNNASISSSNLTSKVIKTSPSGTPQAKYYVAVAPGTATSVEMEYQQNVKVATESKGTKTLEINKIYDGLSMDGKTYQRESGSDSGHNYIKVAGTRWASQNLAASTSTSGAAAFKTDLKVPLFTPQEDVVTGDFFQWGAYQNYVRESNGDKGLLIYESYTATLDDDEDNDNFNYKQNSSGLYYLFSIWGAWGMTEGIDPVTHVIIAPFYNGSSYTQYSSGNLAPEHDAASIVWGSSWRIPTQDEYIELINATYWEWDAGNFGYYVYEPQEGDAGKNNNEKVAGHTYNKGDAILFFPAAGWGVDGWGFSNFGMQGWYWTSSISEYGANMAWCMSFDIRESEDESGVFYYELNAEGCTQRSYGMSIRPILD